jgi:hypothetical protein
MSFSLGDEDINVSRWEKKIDEIITGMVVSTVNRTIESKHPLAITFPGLDSRVHSTKTQVLASIGHDQLLIVETASFKGIPYGDHVSPHPVGASRCPLTWRDVGLHIARSSWWWRGGSCCTGSRKASTLLRFRSPLKSFSKRAPSSRNASLPTPSRRYRGARSPSALRTDSSQRALARSWRRHTSGGASSRRPG